MNISISSFESHFYMSLPKRYIDKVVIIFHFSCLAFVDHPQTAAV